MRRLTGYWRIEDEKDGQNEQETLIFENNEKHMVKVPLETEFDKLPKFYFYHSYCHNFLSFNLLFLFLLSWCLFFVVVFVFFFVFHI